QHIYSRYGFLDSFNPSFDHDLPLRHGRRIPGFGWVDNDHLGVDQGPILALLEHYHTELIWRVMRKNPYLRPGLERAGFSGGWLADAQRDKQCAPGDRRSARSGEWRYREGCESSGCDPRRPHPCRPG